MVDKIDTPDILFRKNLTSGIAFKYRVHNYRGRAISTGGRSGPGYAASNGKTQGFQAPTIPEKVIEIESLLPGRPWLAPNATTTRGNNCLA